MVWVNHARASLASKAYDWKMILGSAAEQAFTVLNTNTFLISRRASSRNPKNKKARD
jgi:hypothetical protein